MTDLVSVVIPTRDRAGLLAQSLRAVLAQDLAGADAEIEVVVVDEGSTDGTAALLDLIEDRRVQVIRHQVPQGLAAARNAGIRATGGSVVGFCDDDDLWMPHKVAAQLRAIRASGAGWALGGALYFCAGPTLSRIARPPSPEVIRAGLPAVNLVPGGGSNVLARRSALDAVGGFDATTNPMEDWDMWVRLAQLGAPAVVDEPVLAYRQHDGNMSRRVPAMLEAARVLDRRYRGLRDGGSLDHDDLYRWMGRAALRRGDRRGAISLAGRAWRAGHAGATRRLLRAALPIPPTQPSRPWPEGTRDWLHAALGVGA